jgi:competence protein ComEC
VSVPVRWVAVWETAMATGPDSSNVELTPQAEVSIWRAPFVPVALAATAGIVLDRYVHIPVLGSLIATVICFVAWAATRAGRQTGLALVYLHICVMALAAGYHHWYRDGYPSDDIGNFATPVQRPVQLRGIIEEEPAIVKQVASDPLRSIERTDPTTAVLQVTHLREEQDWRAVSGRAQLHVTGNLEGFHVGDEVEVVGRLVAPVGPANPGEADYASFLRDQRICAIVLVMKNPGGVTRLARGWPNSWRGWMAVTHSWAQHTLQEALPKEYAGVGTALLLGESSMMTYEDWQKYMRTGVIHVLAISGQHLVVLAAFLWYIGLVLRIRQGRSAWFVALFLLGYSLLTGGRPAVMRSAVMVFVSCFGLVTGRPTMMANSFALAWLVVAALNPTDIFTSGCQLSFCSVAVLYWGTSRLFQTRSDPLDRFLDQTRREWLKALRWLGRQVLLNYLVTLVVWLALAPLVAARYHTIPLTGLALGPPLVLLTSVALVAGFLLLMTGGVWPLAPLFAAPMRWSLAGCDFLVDLGDRLRSGCWYVSDLPEWWLWVFYAGLLIALTMQQLRRWWNWALLAGLGWLCVGLLGGAARLPADELRCTFLAVGHGGCTVLETPDGRTLLYDAGALGGPEVTRRQIAPFLWSRGIRRIDEVFLSHADLDHFNGLPALLSRFAVGQVTCTPTFAHKATAGVRLTLAAIDHWHTPRRIVRAGDRLSAGPVEIEVLHPPADGPEGNENARSMVLLVRHAGHSILLTGDLEGPGLERVLTLPSKMVDVLKS